MAVRKSLVALTAAVSISVLSMSAHAQNANPSNSSTPQAAPNQASQPAPSQASQPASQPANPKPITDLMAAAQRLRDATHDLAREKATEKRGAEIDAIDKALLQVQSAMVALPPNLLLAGVKEKESKKAAAEMARAADRLNAAAGALSDSTNKKTNQSIRDIRKALAEIQQERMKVAGAPQAANSGQSNTGR